MKPMHLALLAGLLAGCGTTGYYHRVSDGLRADATPQALAAFEVDKAICQGEVARADLSSRVGGLIVGVRLEEIMRGCMAGRGYVVR